jgi:hypothetical protein
MWRRCNGLVAVHADGIASERQGKSPANVKNRKFPVGIAADRLHAGEAAAIRTRGPIFIF